MNEEVPQSSQNTNENVSQSSQFIKKFSREQSQEERDALATQIREMRRGRDMWRSEHTEVINEQERIVAELNGLATQIEEYDSDSFLKKITGYLKYRELRAQLAERQGALGDIEGKRQKLEGTPPQFEEPGRLLEAFYSGEEKKWAEAGYTKEDIQKYFSEEHLASLSLEEYALLMRRFPGEIVTHVTRQGVRDHASSFWHTGGEGKFLNGFKDTLLDGRLRSALGIALQEHTKEDAMIKFLKLDEVNSREEALSKLNSEFRSNLSTSHAFADGSSVHVASEVVMDKMYGAEGGNEIFFAFPSAFIASQFHFGGKGDLTDISYDQHNDKWIHTKDHEGISLDSGLVFIPLDTLVHSETGSRYEIDDTGNPMVKEENRSKFKSVVEAPDFKEFAEGAIQIMGTMRRRWNDSNMESDDKKVLKQIEPYCKKLEDDFGILDKRLQFAILNYNTLQDIGYHPDKIDKYIDEGLGREGIYYTEAKQTITSQEYWEQYFVAHPDRRPSKIVYYAGGDPSRAINEWRRENGIVKRTEDKSFGFEGNQVPGDSPEANQHKDRFLELAMKVIDDRFPRIPNPEEEELEIA